MSLLQVTSPILGVQIHCCDNTVLHGCQMLCCMCALYAYLLSIHRSMHSIVCRDDLYMHLKIHTMIVPLNCIRGLKKVKAISGTDG